MIMTFKLLLVRNKDKKEVRKTNRKRKEARVD